MISLMASSQVPILAAESISFASQHQVRNNWSQPQERKGPFSRCWCVLETGGPGISNNTGVILPNKWVVILISHQKSLIKSTEVATKRANNTYFSNQVQSSGQAGSLLSQLEVPSLSLLFFLKILLLIQLTFRGSFFPVVFIWYWVS